MLHIHPSSENRTSDWVTQERKLVYMAVTIADQTHCRPSIDSHQIVANSKRSSVAERRKNATRSFSCVAACLNSSAVPCIPSREAPTRQIHPVSGHPCNRQ